MLKRTKKATMTFNAVISEGFLLPTVRQPITRLQLTKNFVYHDGLIKRLYYINTNEIPGEFSRENLISSHVKITCYLYM